MRILIAPDKFKGVQSAREVAENIAAGLRNVPDATIEIAPMADGGEGTAEAICRARNGAWKECSVQNAIGEKIAARYAWLESTTTAVIEMSEAAGQKRITEKLRDPDHATTFGIGEMILDAIRNRAREIIVGLGGSVTNDGGFGLARALGFRFFAGETELNDAVTDLVRLTRIQRPAKLELPSIMAAADVRNPLLGENGATRVFGPQKGVSEERIDAFELALTKLADVAAAEFGSDNRNKPGAGAAGGLGFGLLTFCGATVRSGFDVVSEAVGLEAKIKAADVIITGEGSLDRQTLEGKAPAEVARMARAFGKCVYAIVGRADDDQALRDLFDGVYAVARPNLSTEENIRRAPELLREGASRLAEMLSKSG